MNEPTEQLPDHLPPIAPPAPLSDEMMAEGDMTEERR